MYRSLYRFDGIHCSTPAEQSPLKTVTHPLNTAKLRCLNPFGRRNTRSRYAIKGMEKSGFNLMITGKLVEGVCEERAIAGLARLLSVDESRAKALLDGKERTVKRDVSMDVLPRYQSALRKIGVESRFRPAMALFADDAEIDNSDTPTEPQPAAAAPSEISSTFTVAETGAPLPKPAKPQPVSVDAKFVLFEPGADLEPIPRDLTPPRLNLEHLQIDSGE